MRPQIPPASFLAFELDGDNGVSFAFSAMRFFSKGLTLKGKLKMPMIRIQGINNLSSPSKFGLPCRHGHEGRMQWCKYLQKNFNI
jgi:hypothetical protein